MAATKMFFITWFSSSTHLKVFQNGFGYACFSDMEDFWARKNFRRLPGSIPCLLPCLPFITNLSVLLFNQMVLIFHLDMYFVCFSDLDLIYMFFRSGSDFERLMGSLLVSLLKYNALEDFQEVFQTTSK
ncbi:hypothetical protein DY000_02007098 [Brassica cretica]|uniref:Uncharacterized protein n=1 Tax=Brassica cretica TaxID=69181 RepID=A0ABQ7BV67_BRACR|nr:hypothetical protein DY000_02007098 [Brassica cretica]